MIQAAERAISLTISTSHNLLIIPREKLPPLSQDAFTKTAICFSVKKSILFCVKVCRWNLYIANKRLNCNFILPVALNFLTSSIIVLNRELYLACFVPFKWCRGIMESCWNRGRRRRPAALRLCCYQQSALQRVYIQNLKSYFPRTSWNSSGWNICWRY